jgi:hypothetical protein
MDIYSMSKREKDMIATIIAGVLGGIAVTTGVWVYAERQKEPPPSVDVAGVVEQVLQLHKPAANLGALLERVHCKQW